MLFVSIRLHSFHLRSIISYLNISQIYISTLHAPKQTVPKLYHIKKKNWLRFPKATLFNLAVRRIITVLLSLAF